MFKVGSRHRSMVWVGLKRHDMTVWRYRASEPDCRITPKGADLKNAPRRDHTSDKVKKLALRRRDIMGRQTGGDIGRKHRLKHGVNRYQAIHDVGIYNTPLIFVHWFCPIGIDCLSKRYHPGLAAFTAHEF